MYLHAFAGECFSEGELRDFQNELEERVQPEYVCRIENRRHSLSLKYKNGILMQGDQGTARSARTSPRM